MSKDGENYHGYHGRNRINERESTDASRPTSLSRNVGIGSEPGPGILGRPMSVAPHGSTDNLAPHLGKFDRNLTPRAAGAPERFVALARRGRK